MHNLKKQLECNFGLIGKNRIAILGVGSQLRGDDAAGMLVAKNIQRHLKDKPKKNIKIFLGETAPENLTGEIKKFKPTHLFIIDSAEMDKEPGEVFVFSPEKIKGVSFCTHQLPMGIMIDYLNKFIKCDVTIIGIQPKALEFDSVPSKEVAAAVKNVTKVILEAIIS
ncbi:MAG: hydrogenase maturation peptidase HycI [Candidatus Omnitrophota bacterium]|jgi:hydrogenase 3 maturation protease